MELQWVLVLKTRTPSLHRNIVIVAAHMSALKTCQNFLYVCVTYEGKP